MSQAAYLRRLQRALQRLASAASVGVFLQLLWRVVRPSSAARNDLECFTKIKRKRISFLF